MSISRKGFVLGSSVAAVSALAISRGTAALGSTSPFVSNGRKPATPFSVVKKTDGVYWYDAAGYIVMKIHVLSKTQGSFYSDFVTPSSGSLTVPATPQPNTAYNAGFGVTVTTSSVPNYTTLPTNGGTGYFSYDLQSGTPYVFHPALSSNLLNLMTGEWQPPVKPCHNPCPQIRSHMPRSVFTGFAPRVPHDTFSDKWACLGAEGMLALASFGLGGAIGFAIGAILGGGFIGGALGLGALGVAIEFYNGEVQNMYNNC